VPCPDAGKKRPDSLAQAWTTHKLARRKKVTEETSSVDSAADEASVNESATTSQVTAQESADVIAHPAADKVTENIAVNSGGSDASQADVPAKANVSGKTNVARAAQPESRPLLSSQQRSAIENVLKSDLFVAQMACVSQLRTQLGELDERVEKERQEQAQLADGIRRQLNALASAISAGKWSPAEGMSQRVSRKLEQLQGKQLQPLKARFEKQRFKLDELADWQDFAARPKLEGLIGEMRALPASGQKPRDLANEIKSLQGRWKDLGF